MFTRRHSYVCTSCKLNLPKYFSSWEEIGRERSAGLAYTVKGDVGLGLIIWCDNGAGCSSVWVYIPGGTVEVDGVTPSWWDLCRRGRGWDNTPAHCGMYV